MESITHREMRNQSAAMLRRVEAGESLLVTNSGRPVAVLRPVAGDALAELEASGQLRRATRSVTELGAITRRLSPLPSAQILADSRGER